jgi:hypothetical protein
MKKSLLLAASAITATVPLAHSQSAWLPAPSQLVATPGYTYQSFDEFWFGNDKVSLNPYDSIQHTAFVVLEYGLCARSALDANIGYTWAESEAFNPAHKNQTDDGLTDTRIGLRYNLLDEKSAEQAWAPTLTLRVGGIIEGTYEENYPFSAGDGASGVETSLLFGKAFGASGFGLYGDIGWRWRNHDVPEDLFGSIGIFQSIKSFTLSFGYRHIQGLSGKDIGEAPFPETKEISQNLEAGLGYRDHGGRYYQVYGAKTLDGRNTGEKWVIGASISLPFGLGSK